MGGELDRPERDAHTSALDHAAEFVERVANQAPARYQALLGSPDIARRLAIEPAFNQGKLYAWAEYLAFRDEFRRRFPDASTEACMNAFCRLFLKNDISLSNLARAMEPEDDGELRRLQRPG